MRVYVLSKDQFEDQMRKNNRTDENIEMSHQVCLISINGSDCQHPKYPELRPYFKQDHSNVLNLIFDDVDEPENEQMYREFKEKGIIMFSESHARKILSFIEKNKDKLSCIVHCAAGISRSGAVGEFINDHIGKYDYKTFKLRNPRTQPNGLVLRTLKRLARDWTPPTTC